jgi:phage-related protein
MEESQELELIWIGSTRREVRGFPRQVRRQIGEALYAAQQGECDPATKPLRGFGGRSVMEIVADHDGDTWCAVYTIRFQERIYVPHGDWRKPNISIEKD